MRLLRTMATLFSAAAIAACHDAVAPVGTYYALVSIDGHALPVTSFGIDTRSTVLAGSLRIDPGESVVRVTHYSDYSANTGQTYVRDETLRDHFRIAGDSIFVGTRNEGGVIAGSTLTLTYLTVPSGAVYMYQRNDVR